ncbi:hypothetical protein HYQ44_019335 [Verticillium longisporum]|nr:hypothetical protein HYQ44_019335 [Verticillium longisporum]
MHTTLPLSVGLSILAALTTAAPAAGHGHRVRSNAGFIAMRQTNNGTAPPANNNNNGGAGSNNTPSDTQLMNAVMGWMNDTGKVTNFVNTATSLTGDEFTRQAQIALNAELDELNHKKILDAGLSDNPIVQSANEVLETQGTFQNVVDVLQAMVNNGPDTAQADVNAINNNRCVNVSAARPTGCLEVAGAPTGALPPAGGANASAPASSPSPTPAPGAGGGNAGNATSKNNGNSAGNKSGTKNGTNNAARGGQAGGAAT